MENNSAVEPSSEQEQFQETLAQLNLRKLWQLPPGSLPTTPTSVTQAWHWGAVDVIPWRTERPKVSAPTASGGPC